MKKKFVMIDFFLKHISMFFAYFVLLVIFGLFLVLYINSKDAINHFGFFSFITSNVWSPAFDKFGGLIALIGTFLTTVISAIIAIPIALGIAIFLVEICPNFLKTPIGIAIELLAAIPSVIYGFWGLFYLGPLIEKYVQPFFNATLVKLPIVGQYFYGYSSSVSLFTASVVLAIMIIPFTAALTRDALKITPDLLKESAYALGATKWETISKVMFRYSKGAIIGAVLISLGRAIGETMAVTFVIGNQDSLPTSLMSATTTVTATIANEFTEASSHLYLSSMYLLAFILFLLSFLLIIGSKMFFLRKVRD